MDFKKIAKAVGKGAVDYLNDGIKRVEAQREAVERYKRMYDKYSDEELKAKYNTVHGEKRLAIAELLNERR